MAISKTSLHYTAKRQSTAYLSGHSYNYEVCLTIIFKASVTLKF